MNNTAASYNEQLDRIEKMLEELLRIIGRDAKGQRRGSEIHRESAVILDEWRNKGKKAKGDDAYPLYHKGNRDDRRGGI